MLTFQEVLRHPPPGRVRQGRSEGGLRRTWSPPRYADGEWTSHPDSARQAAPVKKAVVSLRKCSATRCHASRKGASPSVRALASSVACHIRPRHASTQNRPSVRMPSGLRTRTRGQRSCFFSPPQGLRGLHSHRRKSCESMIVPDAPRRVVREGRNILREYGRNHSQGESEEAGAPCAVPSVSCKDQSCP